MGQMGRFDDFSKVCCDCIGILKIDLYPMKIFERRTSNVQHRILNVVAFGDL